MSILANNPPTSIINPVEFTSITSIAKSPHLNGKLKPSAYLIFAVDRGTIKRSVSQIQSVLNQENGNSFINVNLPNSLKPGFTPSRHRGAELIDALKSSRKRYEYNQTLKQQNYHPEMYRDHRRKHLVK